MFICASSRLHALSRVPDSPLDPQLQLAASVGLSTLRQAQLGAAVPEVTSAIHRTRTTTAIEHQRSRTRSVQPKVHQAATADLQAAGLVSLSLLGQQKNLAIL